MNPPDRPNLNTGHVDHGSTVKAIVYLADVIRYVGEKFIKAYLKVNKK